MKNTHASAALLAALSCALLSLPALAQTPPAPAPPATVPLAPGSGGYKAPGKKAPNPNNGHGKISAVSAASITVTPKNGAAKTFALTPKTKVTLDGQPSTVAALTVGLHAAVASKDGITARAIKAHTKGFKKASASTVAGVKVKGKKNPFQPAATL